MYKDITKENILNGSNASLFIGVPQTRETATGTINGTNADFKITGPIYPKASKAILPTASDVTAETLKGTTYTAATITGIKTGTDTDTGDSIYNTITLATPPTAEAADSVKVNYVEEMQAMINQGVDTTFEQETTEVTYLGSNNTLKSYGSIATSFSAELIVSESTLRQIQKMSFEEETDQTGVDSGMTAYQPYAQPQNLYAYINITDSAGDVIGRLYCESVKVPPVLPSFKTGDNSSVTLDISVGDTPRLVLLDTV